MAEGTADDRNDDEPTRPQAEAELGAAVDEALESEVKRQRARFVQEIIGLDRVEGVGRGEGQREDRLRRDLDADRPDDAAD